MADQVMMDYREAELDPKTRSLMDYAVQVTHQPATLTSGTIDALRAVGWTDAEILTATEIIGFFNYYARLADALGVEPEDFMRSRLAVWREQNR